MDATCKVQDNIHVFRLVHNMCPGFWVHIIPIRGFLLFLKLYVAFDYTHIVWLILNISVCLNIKVVIHDSIVPIRVDITVLLDDQIVEYSVCLAILLVLLKDCAIWKRLMVCELKALVLIVESAAHSASV